MHVTDREIPSLDCEAPDSSALGRSPILPAQKNLMGAGKITGNNTPGIKRPLQSAAIGTLEPTFSRIKFVGSDGFRFHSRLQIYYYIGRCGFANPRGGTQRARCSNVRGARGGSCRLCHFRDFVIFTVGFFRDDLINFMKAEALALKDWMRIPGPAQGRFRVRELALRQGHKTKPLGLSR